MSIVVQSQQQPISQGVKSVAYQAPLQPIVSKEAPPYLSRQLYQPRRTEDFADGGAFPEIHIEQFPLDMGKGGAGLNRKSARFLAPSLDKDGNFDNSALLQQGHSGQKLVEYQDDEEVQEVANNTWAQLQKIVEKKTAASQPKSLPNQPDQPSYVKYTPSQTGLQYNSGAKQRVVRLQDMPVDPLEPPKFRHKKVPRGPGSPPVPVMHSPPKPLTKQEMADWKIPPSISNWKNPKGYTIPLDKRLAADGRGLQEQAVNSKHASFAEALYYAEDKTRQEIQLAAQIKQERKVKQKEQKEQELRNLALQARLERGGGQQLQNRIDNSNQYQNSAEQEALVYGNQGQDINQQYTEYNDNEYNETQGEAEERRQRDQLRMDRKRERDRELRLASKEAHGYKRSKLTRDRERDVSEKVALGQAYTGPSQQHMYDSRLFNQDKGMDSGFGTDDTYNIYDKPWQPERNANLYRPRQTEQQDNELYGQKGQTSNIQTDRFRPDQGFQGADYGARQNGQLEFEGEGQEADPFGLNTFFTDVNKGQNQ